MGMKGLRHNFQPKLYEGADKHGNAVPLKDRAEAAADYLATEQWGTTEVTEEQSEQRNKMHKSNIINDGVQFDNTDFKFVELNTFLKKAKKRKACGPDEIPMEYFKMLDNDGLELIVKQINFWWNSGTFPNEKLKASKR